MLYATTRGGIMNDAVLVCVRKCAYGVVLQVAPPKFCSGPRPGPGRCFLAPRAPSAPSPPPALKVGGANPYGGAPRGRPGGPRERSELHGTGAHGTALPCGGAAGGRSEASVEPGPPARGIRASSIRAKGAGAPPGPRQGPLGPRGEASESASETESPPRPPSHRPSGPLTDRQAISEAGRPPQRPAGSRAIANHALKRSRRVGEGRHHRRSESCAVRRLRRSAPPPEAERPSRL